MAEQLTGIETTCKLLEIVRPDAVPRFRSALVKYIAEKKAAATEYAIPPNYESMPVMELLTCTFLWEKTHQGHVWWLVVANEVREYLRLWYDECEVKGYEWVDDLFASELAEDG